MMNSFYVRLLLHFTLHITITIATTSLYHGQSLSVNQTLLSANAEYRLGFFSPQNNSTGALTNNYLGIWFDKIPRQYFWVANRDAPLTNPNTSQLMISQDGNLVLLEQSKNPVWSSNITQKIASNSSLVATLLDNGNLVLTDSSNSSDVAWQSFDHPTDTLMTEEWFGLHTETGVAQSLTSWKSAQDPGTGVYSFELYPPGSGSAGQYVLIWNKSKVYYYFDDEFVSSIVDMPFNVNYSYEIRDYQFRYKVEQGGPAYTRSVMGVNGLIQAEAWFDSSDRWIVEWPIPNLCDVYSACGEFGICDQSSSSQYCTCLPGFEPNSPSYWDVVNSWDGSSCIRKSTLKCDNKNSSANENQDGFLPVSSLKLPTDGYELMQAASRKICESECINNCSCSAYTYIGNHCKIFPGEIRDLKRVSSGSSDASVLYIRLAASDLPGKKSRKEVYKIAVAATIGSVFLIMLCVWVVFSHKRRIYRYMVTTNGLNQFSYAFMVDCTKKFSQKLGNGSFGSVFKGQLPDSTPIAVKRLEGSRQGEKQFRTEVKTLGQIQHVNLVQLLGFSLKGEERLLVYSLMPNSSLDTHLFNDNSAKNLNWKLRFDIIQGVARGLAYLHDECRECIIHCDIKPENILLDATFSPKIADFGLAKLIGREFGEVLTTTRGTLGYLAPEWISGLPITPKADVYSFGMMLFEIISGKRNRKSTTYGYFPVWAIQVLSSGQVESLLDERLEGEADFEQVARVLYVAGWCVQDFESYRPTMAEVLRILDGSLSVAVPLVPRSLGEIACDEDSSNHPSSLAE